MCDKIGQTSAWCRGLPCFDLVRVFEWVSWSPLVSSWQGLPSCSVTWCLLSLQTQGADFHWSQWNHGHPGRPRVLHVRWGTSLAAISLTFFVDVFGLVLFKDFLLYIIATSVWMFNILLVSLLGNFFLFLFRTVPELTTANAEGGWSQDRNGGRFSERVYWIGLYHVECF